MDVTESAATVRRGPDVSAEAWVRVLGEVSSTQDEARRMAEDGAPAFSYALADFQTQGRGRHGRQWTAPAGSALTMSVVLRPNVEAARLGQVGMAVGLSAVEALDRLGGSGISGVLDPIKVRGNGRFGLKWPNDVVLVAGLAKVGGVLLESWVGGSAVVLAGIGINLTATRTALPVGATSLVQEGIAAPDRGALAEDVVRGIRRHVATLEEGGSLTGAWRARLTTLGGDVVVWSVDGGAERARGRAVAVEDDGGLVVESADGTRTVVHAGDVTLAGDPAAAH